MELKTPLSLTGRGGNMVKCIMDRTAAEASKLELCVDAYHLTWRTDTHSWVPGGDRKDACVGEEWRLRGSSFAPTGLSYSVGGSRRREK